MCSRARIDDLNRLGISPARIDARSSKKELLGLQASLMSSAKTQADKSTFTAISLMAEILKLHHAVELAETQGPDALADISRGWRAKPSPAAVPKPPAG